MTKEQKSYLKFIVSIRQNQSYGPYESLYMAKRHYKRLYGNLNGFRHKPSYWLNLTDAFGSSVLKDFLKRMLSKE